MIQHGKIWIAGLGNALMRDDSIGVVIATMLMENPPLGTYVSEVGTASMSFADIISDAEKIIVIDAVTSGKSPGTITVFNPGDMPFTRDSISAHNLGFFDAVRLFRPDNPPAIKILGVEPEKIEYGLELTEPLKAAIPKIMKKIVELAGQMLQ